MSVQDSRQRTKVYYDTNLLAANMLEDNLVTEATTATMYDKPNYPMKLNFFGTKNVDALWTFGPPTTTPHYGFNQNPYKYRENIPISIFAVNKTGLTATKLLWQCELEARRLAETYGDSSGSIRVLSRTMPAANYVGGFFLYSVDLMLSYMRAATVAQTTATITYGNGYQEDFADGIYGAYVFTATSNGAADGTTIINTAHTQANDYWNGRHVKMLTGTCAGEEVVISDFDAGTDTITLAGAGFSAQIDSGDTYIISDWQETEDGNTTTPSVTNEDWLTLTVSGSGGNAVSYYSYPSEATNHDVNLGLATTTYTTIRYRYICTSTAKAKIVAVFSDASTQEILAATNSTTWTVGAVTLTTAKTLDHIRLYANFSTGIVYYDFVQVCKGNFTFPNIVSLTKSFQRRDALTEVFGTGGDGVQGGGSHSKEFDLTCDLTVSNDTDDWKRPQGTLSGKTDTERAQVFDEIVQDSWDDVWNWISLEDRGAFKALIDIPSAPAAGDQDTLTLHVSEYRQCTANNETEAQRFNRS